MPKQERGAVSRHANYPLSRWKNGAGETREIARHPGTGEFDWRVSMATVSMESDFSAFPGIERWLGVAAGGSLSLTVDGVERELSIGDKPLRFSGSDLASAHPLGSTVTDLNLMVRCGVVDGDVAALGSGAHCFDRGDLLIVSLVDQLKLRVSSADADPFEIDLGNLDTWWVCISEAITIEMGGADSALAYAAQIWGVGN